LLTQTGLTPDAVRGMGLGAPNGNYWRGTIEYAPNLAFKGIVPLVDMLQPHFPGWEIRLTNDANAAALGEKLFGKAREVDDFIIITLGTGVGSGIFSGGKLVYGHDGFAGEVGHMIIEENGRLCGCGRKGCLETYASATGMVRTAREMLARPGGGTSSLMKVPPDVLEARHISEAASVGDRLALDILDYTAGRLGLALANAVAVTSPEVIYLYGGMAAAGELLLRPLRRALEANLLEVFRGKVRLEQSGLPEGDAAILGAAALIGWSESTG